MLSVYHKILSLGERKVQYAVGDARVSYSWVHLMVHKECTSGRFLFFKQPSFFQQVLDTYNAPLPSAATIISFSALAVFSTAASSPSEPANGFASTRSIEFKRPVSASSRAIKSPPSRLRPPGTGVPVLGAKAGSKASMSKESWSSVEEPRWVRACAMVVGRPSL